MKYVVTKRPGEAAKLDLCETETVPYDQLKASVDDQWLEVVWIRIGQNVLDLWIDEEGRLKNLPPNFTHPMHGTIFGPVVVCLHDADGESISLTKELAEEVARWLDDHS